GAALRQLSGKRAVPGHGGAAARGGLPASGLLRCHGVRGGLPDLRRGGPRAAVHGCVSQRAGGDYAGGDDRRGAGGGHQLQAHGRGRPVLQQAVRGGRSGHKRGYPRPRRHGLCRVLHHLAGHHVVRLHRAVLHDGVRGADDLLHGVLHHHHAADPAHPGDGQGHPPLCGGGLRHPHERLRPG
ncbi:Flp pilus-assembly TadG-like N-terminal domain-containing protein, partial [Dysosmobacter welbionis]